VTSGRLCKPILERREGFGELMAGDFPRTLMPYFHYFHFHAKSNHKRRHKPDIAETGVKCKSPAPQK
jgi:hypothetical protein